METNEPTIDEAKQQISRLYYDNIDVEEAIDVMQDQNVSFEFVRDVYTQLSNEVEKLMMDRFHYYTIKGEQNFILHYNIYYWTSRYLLVFRNRLSKSAIPEIEMIDLFNNKSTKVTIEETAELFTGIYHLNDGFGLLEESGNQTYLISLVFLDFHQRNFRKLYTVEHRSDFSKIVPNKADQTTFLLSGEESSRICKIVNNSIIVGEIVKIKPNPDCFYDKFAYSVDWNDRIGSWKSNITIHAYDLEKKTKSNFDIEVPTDYKFNKRNVDWIRNNLFVELKCGNGTNFIGYVNVETREWNILDFSSKLQINVITGFGQGELVVHTQTSNLDRYHFYKIPFGKPDSLENTAWLSLIKAMKKREKTEDPYKAARKYLLPNSDINCLF